MIREFRVSLILEINVVCDEDTPLEVARAKASQQIDEIRKVIPCPTWTDGMPKTIEEIINEEA